MASAYNDGSTESDPFADNGAAFAAYREPASLNNARGIGAQGSKRSRIGDPLGPSSSVAGPGAIKNRLPLIGENNDAASSPLIPLCPLQNRRGLMGNGSASARPMYAPFAALVEAAQTARDAEAAEELAALLKTRVGPGRSAASAFASVKAGTTTAAFPSHGVFLGGPGGKAGAATAAFPSHGVSLGGPGGKAGAATAAFPSHGVSLGGPGGKAGAATAAFPSHGVFLGGPSAWKKSFTVEENAPLVSTPDEYYERTNSGDIIIVNSSGNQLRDANPKDEKRIQSGLLSEFKVGKSTAGMGYGTGSAHGAYLVDPSYAGMGYGTDTSAFSAVNASSAGWGLRTPTYKAWMTANGSGGRWVVLDKNYKELSGRFNKATIDRLINITSGGRRRKTHKRRHQKKRTHKQKHKRKH